MFSTMFVTILESHTWLLSGFVLSIFITLLALCVCGKQSRQKETLEAVETRCVTYTQGSPQIANKQVATACLNGDVVTTTVPPGGTSANNHITSNGITSSSNGGSSSPLPCSTPPHAPSPHIHVSDRALPTPPGRPQSLPAGLPCGPVAGAPSTSVASTTATSANIRGRRNPSLSHPHSSGLTLANAPIPTPPSPVNSIPPAPSVPAPQPPALGEEFARNEGIPDIDADPALVDMGSTNQSDIPYTVISVREPLANLRQESRLIMDATSSHVTEEPVQSPGARSTGEQYYAVVQHQDEEMYAEIESANSSVTYARIEPRQNVVMSPRPVSSQASSSDSPSTSSPVSLLTVVDGAPAPPTVESLKSVAQAHSRQASTSSIFPSINGTSVLSILPNGGQSSASMTSSSPHPPSSLPPGIGGASISAGGDVNVVNNLYSSVDRNAKQRKPPIVESHSGDSITSDVDQLYAKVSKKPKRHSPSERVIDLNNGIHHHHLVNHQSIRSSSPNAINNQSQSAQNHQSSIRPLSNANKVSFENNNSIGVVLPPMTLKRKSSRRDSDGPCYETLGDGNRILEEPRYERLNGSASSDVDPNYEQLKSGKEDDPCYEALGGVSNASDTDPCYERVQRRESDATDPNYERLQRSGDSDVEPRYERVGVARDDSSDVEPCYERVGPKDDDTDPTYEMVTQRSKTRRGDSLSSDPGYEPLKSAKSLPPGTGTPPTISAPPQVVMNGNMTTPSSPQMIHANEVRLNGRGPSQIMRNNHSPLSTQPHQSPRSIVTISNHHSLQQDPEYEAVNTPEIVML